MESLEKSGQMVAHVMERNSVNGARVWASDTAYLQLITHRVMAVLKRELDRLKTCWRKWEGRECSVKMS